MKDPVILRIFKNEQLVSVKQFTGEQMTIGRNSDLDISLEDEHISPIHAMLEKRGDDFYISDLGSESGTFKNAQQVLDDQLQSGDEIQVGPYRLAFFIGVPKVKPATAQPVPPVPKPEEPTSTEPVQAEESEDDNEVTHMGAMPTEDSTSNEEAKIVLERQGEPIFKAASDEQTKVEAQKEAPKKEVPKPVEPKVEEPKKPEPPKVEQPRPTPPPKPDEPKIEEPKVEEPKAEVLKAEEPKLDEPKAQEPKTVEPAPQEPVAVKPPVEAPKKVVPPAEAPKFEQVPKAEQKTSVNVGFKEGAVDVQQSTVGIVKPSVAGNRPSLKSGEKGKTYAPPRSYKKLEEIIKPSEGNVVEVIVAWDERMLQSYHFRKQGEFHAGSDEGLDVALPTTVANQKKFKLLHITTGVDVYIPGPFKVKVITAEKVIDGEELSRQGRFTEVGGGRKIRVEQGEMLRIEMAEGVSLIVRYVSSTPIATLAPALPFTASELTGLVIALMLVSLMALYVAIYSPPDGIEIGDDEALKRIATFIYEKPKSLPPPKPPEPPKELPKPTPPPPEKPKKVKMDMSKRESSQTQRKADKPGAAKTVKQAAAKASEVRPKPDGKNKEFTSVKQDGGKKLGETDSANAQSAKKDISKVGLFGAFGGKGVREKLDQAYSGAGEILGAADAATGTSGQNADREGSDLGSRFKDTGAGGQGTATQGIAGVKTKGRGGGQSAYGQEGLGGREGVNIEFGGSEEVFQGGIDREAVRRVIRQNLHHVRACYEKELNSTRQQLEGTIVLQWEIATQGRVQGQPIAIKNTLGSDRVANCIIGRLKVWQFPEPPPGVIGVIDYPFLFKKSN